MKNVKAAINHFINDTEHGEAWKKILLYAPERAGVRIICSMYYSFHKHNLTEEELDEYHEGRDWIETVLSEKDLKYLISVMPQRQKPHYLGMLVEKDGDLE